MITNNSGISAYREIINGEGRININSLMSYSKVHGPGNRFSIWVQGCLQRCDGCTNPKMLDINFLGNLVGKDDLISQILKARDSVTCVEGITLQGGEPMLQARNLIPIFERIKIIESNKMNTLVFTGYTLEQLQELNNSAIKDLLALTDTLIDGPFKRKLIDNKLIRGSTNQRIIHLTDTLKFRDFCRQGTESSISITNRGIRRVTTGINI